MDEGPPDVIDEIRSLGEQEAAFELLQSIRIAAEQFRRADRVEGVGQRALIVERLGELERPAAPRESLVELVAVLANRGHRRVGPSQLAARRQLLEHILSLLCRSQGICHPPRAPEDVGQPTQGIALGTSVAQLSIAVDRTVQRSDRLIGLVGEIALA